MKIAYLITAYGEWRHLERLVAAYILHKKGHPNAPRLSRTRALAARAVYGALAPDCRKAFGLFRAMGCSEQEIAEKLDKRLGKRKFMSTGSAMKTDIRSSPSAARTHL